MVDGVPPPLPNVVADLLLPPVEPESGTLRPALELELLLPLLPVLPPPLLPVFPPPPPPLRG